MIKPLEFLDNFKTSQPSRVFLEDPLEEDPLELIFPPPIILLVSRLLFYNHVVNFFELLFEAPSTICRVCGSARLHLILVIQEW